MESSTKQYPTNLKLLPDMQHLNAAPNPCSLSAFSIGVLTSTHMHGSALFPCPNPCGGGLH
eukprot:13318574-Ditylum_brightwellii.AAC.1